MDILTSPIATALENHLGHPIKLEHLQILHRGRFANAIVFRYRDKHHDLVIKDYSHCRWTLRQTIGRLFIRREQKNLDRLHHLSGVVPTCHRLTPVMLAYPFVEGASIKALNTQGQRLPADFFHAMEQGIQEMHQRDVVHLDLRNLGNVLCRSDGAPHFIDFQSAISLRWVPRRLHAFLKASDRSAVYKAWDLLCDEPLPDAQRVWLNDFNRLRKRWILRGYPLTGVTTRIKTAFRTEPSAEHYQQSDRLPPATRQG